MSSRSIGLSDDLHEYLVAHNPTNPTNPTATAGQTPQLTQGGPDPLVVELIEATHRLLPDRAQMQIAPEQAAFLTFLTRLIKAEQAIEIGTFTGLSALSIARGLTAAGRLRCLDVSTEYTNIAKDFWRRAGVADRIDLVIAPAQESLAGLPAQPYLDLAFIDADKTGYPAYWAALVPRMRPGGVIVVDNVLRGGRVLAPEDPDTVAMVAFNDMVLADKRVESVMLPLSDGLTLARRLAD